ncbi:MAG: hypothetical protein HYX66_08825 [Ignavibacteria bacterium]|nr:hypothetical protein [Ignavibacteria bacterium]
MGLGGFSIIRPVFDILKGLKKNLYGRPRTNFRHIVAEHDAGKSNPRLPGPVVVEHNGVPPDKLVSLAFAAMKHEPVKCRSDLLDIQPWPVVDDKTGLLKVLECYRQFFIRQAGEALQCLDADFIKARLMHVFVNEQRQINQTFLGWRITLFETDQC